MKEDKKKEENKKLDIIKLVILTILLVALIVVSIVLIVKRQTNDDEQDDKVLAYTELVKEIQNKNVEKIEMTVGSTTLKVKLKDEEEEKKAIIPNTQVFMELIQSQTLEGNEIKLEQKTRSVISQIPSYFFSILPTAIMVALFIMIYKMQGLGDKGQVYEETERKTKITFDDIAGLDEEKAELKEIVEFLKEPKRFTEMGAKIPKGVLLYGKPGTGKTLIAKAFIAESKLPFIMISGSEINNAKDIKHLFLAARAKESCIIFIDEFDVMGKENKNNERIIAQLAYEMNKRDHVLVIATTRNIKEISSSLKRPKHFEMFVSMFLPDFDNRMQIIEYCCNKKRVDPSVSVKKLAKKLIGASTLEIIKIMNMAIEIAEQKHHKNVLSKDFCEAQINCDEAVPLRINRTFIEKKATAYHEAGHAICVFLSQIKRIRDISIIPTQEFFGRVATYPLNEYGKMTKQDFEIEIMISLAGRVAEDVFFNSPTSGAKGDLEKTTKLVKQYLTEFCFDEEIGIAPISCLSLEQLAGSDLNNRLLNRSVDLMNLFYKRTKEYLLQNKTMLEEIAQNLLQKEVLSEEEVYAIYNKYNPK